MSEENVIKLLDLLELLTQQNEEILSHVKNLNEEGINTYEQL